MPVFSYIRMPAFFIHFYACFFHTFVCVFVCVFFSYICMRVFVIHLYLGWPWRSGECGRPITRGLAVQSPLTAQQKNWWADTWRRGSSPPCHGSGAIEQGTPYSLGAVIGCPPLQYMSIFFSYICMRVFLIHLYACFSHIFVCDFVCVFLSYIFTFVFGLAVAQW